MIEIRSKYLIEKKGIIFLIILLLLSQLVYAAKCTGQDIQKEIRGFLQQKVDAGELSQDKLENLANMAFGIMSEANIISLLDNLANKITEEDYSNAKRLVSEASIPSEYKDALINFIDKQAEKVITAPSVILTLADLNNVLDYYKQEVFNKREKRDYSNLESRVIKASENLGIIYDSVPVVFENKQYDYYYNKRMPSPGALSVDAAMESIIAELRARPKPVIITIDGRPGTGKSWFAKKLKGKLYNEFKPEVIARDKAENRDVLESQVMAALRKNNVVIVEGVYTNDLSFGDVSVVNVRMETSPETAANNIITRPKRADDARLMLDKSEFDNILYSNSIDQIPVDIVVWNERALPKDETIESPREVKAEIILDELSFSNPVEDSISKTKSKRSSADEANVRRVITQTVKDLYNSLASSPDIKNDPERLAALNKVFSNAVDWLIAQDEADLALPFVAHDAQHSETTMKDMNKVLNAMPKSIRDKFETKYGRHYAEVISLLGLLHDIGYAKLEPGEPKGLHAPKGGSVVGRAIKQEMMKAFGLDDQGFKDFVEAIARHGSDKKGKDYLAASLEKNPLLLMMRLSDNLDITFNRLRSWQRDKLFMRSVFKLWGDSNIREYENKIDQLKSKLSQETDSSNAQELSNQIERHEGLINSRLNEIIASSIATVQGVRDLLQKYIDVKTSERYTKASRADRVGLIKEAFTAEQIKALENYAYERTGKGIASLSIEEMQANLQNLDTIINAIPKMNHESFPHFIGAFSARDVKYSVDKNGNLIVGVEINPEAETLGEELGLPVGEYQVKRTIDAVSSLFFQDTIDESLPAAQRGLVIQTTTPTKKGGTEIIEYIKEGGLTQVFEKPKPEAKIPTRSLDEIIAQGTIDINDLEALAVQGKLRKASGAAGIVFIDDARGIVIKVSKLKHEIIDPKYSEQTARQQLENEFSLMKEFGSELRDEIPELKDQNLKQTADGRLLIVETKVAGKPLSDSINKGEISTKDFALALKKIIELQQLLSSKGLYFIDWNLNNVMIEGTGDSLKVSVIDLGQATKDKKQSVKDVQQLKYYTSLAFELAIITQINILVEQGKFNDVKRAYNFGFEFFGSKGRIIKNEFIQQKLVESFRKTITQLVEKGEIAPAQNLFATYKDFLGTERSSIEEIIAKPREAVPVVKEKPQVPEVISSYSDIENCSDCTWPRKGQPGVSVAMEISKEQVVERTEDMRDWISSRINVNKEKVILVYDKNNDVLKLRVENRQVSEIEDEFELLFLSVNARISKLISIVDDDVKIFSNNLGTNKLSNLVIMSAGRKVVLHNLKAEEKILRHKEYHGLFRQQEKFKSMFEDFIPNEVILQLVKTVIATKKPIEEDGDLVYEANTNHIPQFKGLLDLAIRVVVNKDSGVIKSFYPLSGVDSYKLAPAGNKISDETIYVQDRFKDNTYLVVEGGKRIKNSDLISNKKIQAFLNRMLYVKKCE